MNAVIVGVSLGLIIGIFGTRVGLDRDRAMYPIAMIVIAAYYSLFAVMGDSMHALLLELLAGSVFVVLAVAGFKRSLWIAAAAVVGHGLFDIVHGAIIANPGMPEFWPAFCSSIDIVLGLYLAWLLKSGRVRATINTG